ncbi:MAG: DUF3618 domain-containing protein [Solirubrobacterales bacterium]|nr:DUF3618 domain-containing protein [Solirubrobacterales bacterium]
MGEDPRPSGPALTGAGEGDQNRSPEQIREEIEATRQELGDTIEALAEKTDVKAQAQHKLDEAKVSFYQKRDQLLGKRNELLGKKDELLGKAREASPDTAVSAANQASQKARENPIPLAVIGAVLLGFLFGRLSKRNRY